ncbi:C39 family peptidase [Psychrobacillus sp. OK032]|uniref:C39 family peptidase n=1 Tax=Psychrobacillus sp. OK032 TaxID=1884358 RepID=UPI0008CDDEF5|nr:C39 family peptidase [Psychrobacillus sp. OK032]SES17147.1 Peptidase_C39 like family protein [Psychrobacillus sp. OK032]
MKIQLPVQGISQYDSSIHTTYRTSACGPVTAYVLLNYLSPNKSTYHPNDLYKRLGGTRIGLFTHRFVRNMRKILGPNWQIEKCSLHTALNELKNGRLVALKFDKYFSLQWNKKSTFAYHWVPLIGYEMANDELVLIIHDNGGRNRESKIRKVPYSQNASILTFIRVTPTSNIYF